MEFLYWHYTQGLRSYLKRWSYVVSWVVHYFSLTILLPTLFSPWRRLTDDQEIVGLNVGLLFEQMMFNLISRCIGAFVRIFLFLTGSLLLIPAFVAGFAGLICWLLLPFISLPNYWYYEHHGQKYIQKLAKTIISSKNPLDAFLDTPPSKFLLSHVNLKKSSLIEALANPLPQLNPARLLSCSSYFQMVNYFLENGFISQPQLRLLDLNFSDVILAAKWWDSMYLGNKEEKYRFNRPGVGLELLFGYTPQLNQYSQDLSMSQSFSHHLIAREDLVSRMERAFSAGSSIILTGEPGVGKKTVVMEFARRATSGELGSQLSYQRVLDFDYNVLLSQSWDINKKKSQLSGIFKEAASAGNIILVIKDLHRLTSSFVEGVDFTDVFEKNLESHKLKLIVISSSGDYERFLASNTRLRKYFETIEVSSPSPSQAIDILVNEASLWERQKHLQFTVQAIAEIVRDSDKYVTDTPFPEKALELMDYVTAYVEKAGRSLVTADDVTMVMAERTGIPLARLNQQEKEILANLESIFHQELIGQDKAAELISKSLRARTVGVKDSSRPVGSFLFLGPTGVGKTQAARTLAKIYYGSEKEIMRFDMAEFIGVEGLERLIGSSARNMPGTLTTSLKNKPASLLLLDEIEKASPEIYNLFLTLLDEGYITDAFGKKIVARHSFVIATSNAGAEFIRERVASGMDYARLQHEVMEYVQQNRIFSPEFLNRFDGIVVFEPLTPGQLVSIAKLMLKSLGDNLEEKNIHLDITPEVCQKIADESYAPEFGARPMRRAVDLAIGDILGKAILSGQVKSGDRIQLLPHPEKDSYSVQIM